jgi:CDGSH-type Zn-finger protein
MADVSIQTLQDGPLCVKGPVELIDGAGGKFDLGGRTEIYLCRCGQSGAKPFCNGTHAKRGFKANEPARVLPPP